MRINELQLDELTGYRSNPVYKLLQQSKHIDGFIDGLEEEGFEVNTLGQGYFAVVFERPGGKDVYKLFTAKDKGYLSYLQFVKQNQNNPHVPKIYGGLMRVKMPLNDSKHHGEDWILVRIEKLSDRGNHPELNSVTMNHYISSQPDFTSRHQSSKLPMKPNALKAFEKKYPQMAQVLKWIASNGNRNGVTIDLHGDNYLFRGDTVVITDPFSYFP